MERQGITEADIIKDLAGQSADCIIEKLFSYFPISCYAMQQLDIGELELLILKTESADYNKERLIRKIVNLIKEACYGVKELTPVTENALKRLERHIKESSNLQGRVSEIMGVDEKRCVYISRQLKKALGKTLNQYKTELQILKAKAALAEGDKSITDIALECGFCTSSYFSESFKKTVGITPKEYRRIMQAKNDLTILDRADDNDMLLFNKLPFMKIADEQVIKGLEKRELETYHISVPNEEYSFLHEAAVIEFHGRLFAAWYNNTKFELNGRTPIRFSVSEDGGKGWSEPVAVADDISGKIMFCPPVFGIEGDRLYMFMNQMVKPDHMHSLDLYVYNEEKNSFERLWSRPIPFKLNTNVYTLPSGKLMLFGRVGELDKFPATPAVLISDSGRIDAEWRMVLLQKDEFLPDGAKYIHPEISAVLASDGIYVFCRNDERSIPIIYVSRDEGETWSGPIVHNIPFSASKIYSGTLSDGRNYAIGNIDSKRRCLAFFITDKNDMSFNRGFILQNGYSKALGSGEAWHYPCAYEADGRLYIVYTENYDESFIKRGLVISVIDLSQI